MRIITLVPFLVVAAAFAPALSPAITLSPTEKNPVNALKQERKATVLVSPTSGALGYVLTLPKDVDIAKSAKLERVWDRLVAALALSFTAYQWPAAQRADVLTVSDEYGTRTYGGEYVPPVRIMSDAEARERLRARFIENHGVEIADFTSALTDGGGIRTLDIGGGKVGLALESTSAWKDVKARFAGYLLTKYGLTVEFVYVPEPKFRLEPSISLAAGHTGKYLPSLSPFQHLGRIW